MNEAEGMTMRRFDLYFLLLAAVSLVVGVGMGVFMGMTHDFTLMPVHAHLNLLGWTSLALFGLVHRAYPQLGDRWTARLHLALAAPSAFLLPAGIAVSIMMESPVLAIVASLMWLAGCLVFLGQLVGLAFGAAAAGRLAPAE
jgi:hypothetical protein